MLSDAQTRQFREDGFTVVPQLLERDIAKALLRELARLRGDGHAWDVSLQPLREVPPTNLHFGDLSAHSSLVRALVLAPCLLAVATQLLGEPIVFLQDQAFWKPAFIGLGTCWHQDNTYFQLADPAAGLGIWIALHPATVANGTMRVIPGSHHQTIAHRLCPGTAYIQRAQDVDESRAVAIELAPGGAVIFHTGVLHCTGDNTSADPRAALAVHYVHADQCAGRDQATLRRIVRAPGDGPWRALDEAAWRDAVAAQVATGSSAGTCG